MRRLTLILTFLWPFALHCLVESSEEEHVVPSLEAGALLQKVILTHTSRHSLSMTTCMDPSLMPRIKERMWPPSKAPVASQ